MVVFPVKTEKEDSAVSPLFGRAKYFAFYEDGELDIKVNPFTNGSSIIDWFTMKGVKNVVIKEMGMNPYKKLKATNMRLFYSGDGRVTTNDIIERYTYGCLEEMDEDKMFEIIDKHEHRGKRH